VQPWKEFLKESTRVARLAKDIADDFRANVEPLGFKAQVVAVDKEGCHFYYRELLNYFRPEELAVVISETTKASGEETYNKLKDYNLSEGDTKEVIRRFKRRIADRYEWLLTIYRIYLSEFKRKDFDAEFFAAKTRKLIRESARLKHFAGHLPEIAIDARYLENLRYSKLSDADKLEKILRDIETVIREREAENPAYIDLDEHLQALVDRKRQEAADLVDLLHETEALYQQLDQVANEPARMGFADRGRYDLFLDLKHNTRERFDEDKARRFVETLVRGLQQKRFRAGWHESDLELNAIRTDLKVLSDGDEYESLGIGDDENLVEKLMNRLEQHYAVE
jgi:type I restriction enzyme, R subunit